MPTETELRAALRHRADSTDAEIEDALDGMLTTVLAAPVPGRPPVRMAVAVCAVLAVAAGYTVVQTRHTSSSDRPVAPPVTATRQSATPPPTLRTPHAMPSQVDVSGLVDLIAVGTAYPIVSDLRTDEELLTVQLPGGKHAQLTAFAPSIHFDAQRIGQPHAVTIKTGPATYGRISLWPADGKPDPMSGKQDGAVASLAWQLDDGTWVVLQNDNPDSSASDLVALGDSFTVAPRSAPRHLPFTLGVLPNQFQLQYVEQGNAQDSSGSSSVTLHSSSGDLSVTLDQSMPPTPGFSNPGVTVSRDAGALVLSVYSETYSQATLQHVLDGITVVADSSSETDAWPTLTQALR